MTFTSVTVATMTEVARVTVTKCDSYGTRRVTVTFLTVSSDDGYTILALQGQCEWASDAVPHTTKELVEQKQISSVFTFFRERACNSERIRSCRPGALLCFFEGKHGLLLLLVCSSPLPRK